MYPECVIASWDALILLLDAETIEWRVHAIGRRKKIECLCKLKTPRKIKFVFRENNFYQLIDSSVTGYFAVNFQTKAEN